MKEEKNENKVEEPIAGYGTGYTYADYMKFEFDEMVELIKGKIFKMSPAPKSYHQEIGGNLYLILGNYLKDKACKVYFAPFDVVLPIRNESKDKSTTVVQPDICVICDLSKIDDAGCFGAPDFIVEIISASTSKKDMNNKYQVYEEAGVKEYWIVFPKDEIINCYVLQNGKYSLARAYTKGEKATLYTLPELTLDVDEVFFIKK
ncbi:MAG: Uma2 family endonuclease [Bacteroidota bacterium]